MQIDSLREKFNEIAPITDEEWNIATKYFKVLEYKKNDFFHQVGEVEKNIGFILKGSFKWYYLNSKAEKINFYFCFENDFISEFVSYLSEQKSRTAIQAMEDSKIVLFPDKEIISKLFKESHNWESIGRVLTERVYLENTERLQDSLFLNIDERYLKMITEYPHIFQKVSLSDIASYLGIQGPSLSRIRKRIASTK